MQIIVNIDKHFQTCYAYLRESVAAKGQILMTAKQRKLIYSAPYATSWNRELFYSDMYPPNTTLEWIDTDKPENAQFDADITYTFNEWGFRSDSFDDRSDINIIVLGCSMTIGVGVALEDIWAERVRRMIQESTGKSVTIWNLALSGASGDYVVRTLYKIRPTLNPDYIFICWPPIARMEMPRESHPDYLHQCFIESDQYPQQLVNEDYLLYHLQKNSIMFKMWLGRNNGKIVGFDVAPDIEIEGYHMNKITPFKTDTAARDGLHPGPVWHKAVADYLFEKWMNRA